MLRMLAVLASLTATQAMAQDLLPRLEAAQVALDGQMLVLMGDDPAKVRWTPKRRAQSACALAELERRRGRRTAEIYVREVERAAVDARKVTHVGDIGGLLARIHGAADLRLQRDLFPITRQCGIGL